MGKSGTRRKKSGGGAAQAPDANPKPLQSPAPSADAAKPPPVYSNGSDIDATAFLRRAHELKEEGNRRFQAKEYTAAMEFYDLGLKLLPRSHPDRAILHSNRAACLLQMAPVDLSAVAAECSLALLAQPRFPRALLRRARAFEALGRPAAALQDVQTLLAADPSHREALELARRLRGAATAVESPPQSEAAQQDMHSRPSPAALGASAVRGAPIGGLGPCLPARPVPKKTSPPPPQARNGGKPEKTISISPDLKKSNPRASASESSSSSSSGAQPSATQEPSSGKPPSGSPLKRWRPLKLVYDHDIRLSEMPEDCNFKALREIVGKRFPSSKSVLIKYKDADGDLVTVTSTAELKIAMEALNPSETLRLHVVDVSPEQEPPLPEEHEEPEEQEEPEQQQESEEQVEDDGKGEGDLESGSKPEKSENEKEAENSAECKEAEMDDWLFEFAQLFRTQVGIDPDAHLDLHELGMELCSDALEETVTSEEAQELFDMAAAKFQEVAALAFFNWGNVHMCAARKRIPLDNAGAGEAINSQLQSAFDWVRRRYDLAGEKYEQALKIKPDFYEGLLALGQQHFETAKLQWSFALAQKLDLSSWDSTKTIELFDSAEEKMKAASAMWEQVEEQRAAGSKREETLRKKRKPAAEELTPEDTAEQAAVMRSQIHLFWGNMLFERSQVEFKLAAGDWKKNLDAAVERFKLAGASEEDIAVVLKNHFSNVDQLENGKVALTSVEKEASSES